MKKLKFDQENELHSFRELVTHRQSFAQNGDKSLSTRGYSVWFSMSPEEWDKLLNINQKIDLRAAPCILTFDAGDVIVRSGQRHCMLAQILKGSCAVTPKRCNSPTMWLGCGDIIGDIEFLADCSSVSTVTASENNTTICVIDRKYISDLVNSNQSLLAAKFYRQLCQSLSIRFRNS